MLVLMLVLVIVFAAFFKRIDHDHEQEHELATGRLRPTGGHD